MICKGSKIGKMCKAFEGIPPLLLLGPPCKEGILSHITTLISKEHGKYLIWVDVHSACELKPGAWAAINPINPAKIIHLPLFSIAQDCVGFIQFLEFPHCLVLSRAFILIRVVLKRQLVIRFLKLRITRSFIHSQDLVIILGLVVFFLQGGNSLDLPFHFILLLRSDLLHSRKLFNRFIELILCYVHLS